MSNKIILEIKEKRIGGKIIKTDPESVKKREEDKKKKEIFKKAIEDAGLNFKPSPFKKWIKEQLSLYKDNNKHTDFRVTYGHIAMSAVNEILCKFIFDQVIKYLVKSNDGDGLYNLKAEHIKDAIFRENNLKDFFANQLIRYNPKINNNTDFCIKKNDLDHYIEKYYNKQISLKEDGYSLLIFLLKNFSSDMIFVAKELLLFSKKSSIDHKCIISTINILCPDVLINLLHQKINSIKFVTVKKDKKEFLEIKEEKKKSIKEESDSEDESDKEESDKEEFDDESE
jgi:hypothetical protein